MRSKPLFVTPWRGESNEGKWSERQDLNLQKTPDSVENPNGDTQRDSQTPVVLGPDLSQVVTAWVKLPAPLKAAILAIVKSAA
jgi:hypothetical protein